MPQSNELRVFISSTFRDLQEEREHLVKKIFPEIRALCRQRGITFTEVDLRWGLTEEQATLGTVIRTCLEEVDKCRPYFIGLLGSRYGWIPDLHEVMIDPDLLAKYPWVEEAAINGTSLTEMEFIHGVFNAANGSGNYDYFYHRPLQTAEADDPEKLSALIDRVRKGGYPLREFSSAEELGQLVHDDLLGMINRYWPEDHVPSALEIERRSHAAFSASRRRAYIPNLEHLKEFNVWLNEGTTPLVVSAESGLGKSALAAYLTETYRVKHPTAVVIEHYVGASEQSGSALSLVRHIVEEIRVRYAIAEEVPSDPQKLLAGFANWLWRLGHLAKEEGEEVLVVLDALNQLDEAGRRLTWLPPMAPEKLKLLVTVTPGDALKELRKRGWQELQLASIEEERVRQSIVLRYLGEFHKGIAPEQLRRITKDQKSSSPLYLRVVAEELRLHGEHETLSEVIEQYVTADDLDEVFQQVLDRMERDYGAGSVREVLSLIWCSRSGLSETEVLELTGSSRLELSRLLFALDYHLLHRDGLLGFFHDYLRRAVEKRYLADEAKRPTAHLQIAEYFQSGVMASIAGSGTAPLRMADELTYQLHTAGATDRLGECLSTIPVFVALYAGPTQYEVLGYWKSIGEGSDVVGRYRRGLAEWSMEDAGERSRGMGKVTGLLERLGEWAGAIELARERLASAIEHGYKSEEAVSRRRIGWLLFLRGEYDEALDELTQALDLFTELGDRSGVSLAIGNMGGVYFNRGEYDRTIECNERCLRINEELGDRRGVSYAIGNMGSVYASRGEYDQALESYERLLRISEELGDRSGISRTIGNMGSVYSIRGEYDRAIECFERQLRIDEELGDRHGISLAIGTIGMLYTRRGEYDRALECYERQLRISDELGDRSGISRAIMNMGGVYYYRGEYDRALECFQQGLSISEELGDRREVARAIGNMGVEYYDRGEYDRALECFQQGLSISEELGDRSEIALVIGNMGVVYSSRGEYDRALENLHRAAGEHRLMGVRNLLVEWLGGIGTALVELAQAGRALPEYLPRYIPGATVETWHTMSLRYARACVEESIAISDELSKPDTQFSGRVLLARIEAAEGRREVALQRLTTLLETATDDTEQAELHYQLWKLSESGHAVQALALYEALNAQTPNHDYHKRIEELKAAGEHPAGGDPAGGGSSSS